LPTKNPYSVEEKEFVDGEFQESKFIDEEFEVLKMKILHKGL
jgi:hypothetical protein